MLNQDQIQNFQRIYKERFGIDIDKATALRKGTKLLRLMQLVWKPMTEEQLHKTLERIRQLTKEL